MRCDGALIKAYLRPFEEEKVEEFEEEKVEKKDNKGKEINFMKKEKKVFENAGEESEYATDSIVHKKNALTLLKMKNVKIFQVKKSTKKLSPLDRLLRDIRDPQIAKNCTNVLEHFRKIASKTNPKTLNYKSTFPKDTVKSTKKKRKKRKKKKHTKSSLSSEPQSPTFTAISERSRLDSLGYPTLRSDLAYYE